MIQIILATVVGLVSFPVIVIIYGPLLIIEHLFKPRREVYLPTEEENKRAEYLAKLDKYTKNNW